jgi:hypothetical protein
LAPPDFSTTRIPWFELEWWRGGGLVAACGVPWCGLGHEVGVQVGMVGIFGIPAAYHSSRPGV